VCDSVIGVAFGQHRVSWSFSFQVAILIGVAALPSGMSAFTYRAMRASAVVAPPRGTRKSGTPTADAMTRLQRFEPFDRETRAPACLRRERSAARGCAENCVARLVPAALMSVICYRYSRLVEQLRVLQSRQQERSPS